MALCLRRALAAGVVVNLAPVVGRALLWWPSDHAVFFNSVFAVVTLVFSAAVGTWIIRVVEQSQDRATLIAGLDASRHELSRLSAAHGALAERERLSRDIHDTLAQGFTSLLMLTQAVEAELDRCDVVKARRHLALMEGTARQNLAEARALVAGGTPADLDGASVTVSGPVRAARRDGGRQAGGRRPDGGGHWRDAFRLA
ncbi:histidine kinase [Streptomyces sp. NPDC127119]|uniref:histidine kinase n=1 Tax=Streptomyces sp. NPDC127119 TaxID=3345370 RepID=UPI003629A945